MPHTDIDVFVAVVENSGFSAAAVQLGLTRSAVSRRIEALEGRLGVRLLDRTTRRLALTDAGGVYHQHALRILANIREAETAVSAFQDTPKGVLTVLSPVMIGIHLVVPALKVFLAENPELNVQLTVSDDPKASDEPHDVVFAFGRQPDSSMIGVKLAETRRIICAAPSYLDSFGRPSSPDDLRNHNCLLISGLGTAYNEWMFRKPGGGVESIRVAGSLTVNSGDAHYEALIRGVGIGRVTDLRVRADVAASRIVPLLEAFEPEEHTPIYALYLNGRHVAPKIRALVDHMRDWLRQG